jgi:hypothetical protein
MSSPLAYFRALNPPRIALWCYLLWYLVMVIFHFDPAPRIWLTSIGISFIIGFALDLNGRAAGAPKARGWALMRLYLFPFCVSSFSSLVKDHGFILVFSPVLAETGMAVGLCAAFWLMVLALRRFA